MVQFPQLKVIVNQVGDALNGYFANNLQQRKPNGFTIVELLIVIVVIGILAAIVIVAYQGVTNRANDSAIKSDLKSLSNKLQIFYTHNDEYPSTTAQLESLGFKASRGSYDETTGNMLYCAITAGANARFVVAAKSKSKAQFTHSSGGSGQTYTGAWTGAHGTDCKIYGIPDTGEPNRSYAQGYHPP